MGGVDRLAAMQGTILASLLLAMQQKDLILQVSYLMVELGSHHCPPSEVIAPAASDGGCASLLRCRVVPNAVARVT